MTFRALVHCLDPDDGHVHIIHMMTVFKALNYDYIDPAPKYVLIALNEDGAGAKDHLDALRVCSDLNFVRRHLWSMEIRRNETREWRM